MKMVKAKKKIQTSDGFMYSPVSEEEGVLKSADYELGNTPKSSRGTIITNPGDTEKAFGPLLKSKTFNKGLRKLQMKRKVTMLT